MQRGKQKKGEGRREKRKKRKERKGRRRKEERRTGEERRENEPLDVSVDTWVVEMQRLGKLGKNLVPERIRILCMRFQQYI